MINFSKPDYLYRLARSGSASDRQDLAFAMQTMFDTPHRTVAQEILSLLLKEAEHDLRLTLAHKLSAQKDCPFELIHFLVYENPISIAEIAIKNSPLLDDDELLKIAETFAHDPHYSQAIAQRERLSARVVSDLLQRGDDQTQLLLLQNANCELNETCLTYLIDVVREKPDLQQPFLQRKEVTPALAAQLYWHVSMELRQHIMQYFPMDAARLDRAMEDSVQHHTTIKAGHIALHNDARSKAEHLYATGSLTVRHTMETLRKGDVSLFICMVALMTRVNPESVLQALMTDDNNEALAVIAHVLRLNRSDFNGLYLLWRRQTMAQQAIYKQDMERAMVSFSAMTPHHAQDILTHWRAQ
jgi:uncharacterized protein (DUF2336 family)